LNAFFVWCEKPPRKWIVSNPVKDVEKFEVAQGIPEILSADKVKALFAFLETYRGGPRKPLYRASQVLSHRRPMEGEAPD
jgi:site-specific recombinase XerD